MILLLCDILKPVNMLSLYLQEEHVNFTMLASRVSETIDELTDIIQKYRDNNLQNTAFSKCQALYNEITERTDLARRIREREQQHNMTPQMFLEATGIPFIYSLINEIQDAFHCGPVLSAFGFLDPRNLPKDVDNLHDYGDTDILRLSEFYGKQKEDVFQRHRTVAPADFDQPELTTGQLKKFRRQLYMMSLFILLLCSQLTTKPEWRMRLHNIHRSIDSIKQRNADTNLKGVFHNMKHDGVLCMCFPRVLKLVEYALLIPASTAVVERGFSLINDLCTPLRSSLTQNSLDALMRICREGKDQLTNDQLEIIIDDFKERKTRKLAL